MQDLIDQTHAATMMSAPPCLPFEAFTAVFSAFGGVKAHLTIVPVLEDGRKAPPLEFDYIESLHFLATTATS